MACVSTQVIKCVHQLNYYLIGTVHKLDSPSVKFGYLRKIPQLDTKVIKSGTCVVHILDTIMIEKGYLRKIPQLDTRVIKSGYLRSGHT